MLKIKDTLIKKIYSSNLTKYELVALIEFIKISDEEGIAYVYYKEMVKNIGCKTATFYNVVNSLQEKGFIECCKNNEYKSEMIIGINNNNFKNNYNCYVDMRNVFICDNIFHDLTAGEIRLMLYFLFRIYKQKYSNDIKSIYHDKNKLWYNASYSSIANRLKITKRMVKKHIKGLLSKKIICVKEKKDKIENKYDIITVLQNIMNAPERTVTQKGKRIKEKIKSMQLHYVNYVQNVCRRNKINIMDSINLNDTAMLMTQYLNISKKKEKNIYRVIDTAIKNLKTDILDSKVLHYIIKNLIYKDYNENIIAY